MRAERSWARLARGAVAVGAIGAAFVVAYSAGGALGSHGDRIRARWESWRATGRISSEAYELRLVKLRIPTGGRDGGIAALGPGVLIAGRDGGLWYADEARRLHPNATRIPVNADEFRRHPANVGIDGLEQFGVKDILLQERGAGIRVFASHSWYDAGRQCYVLRLSMLDTAPGTLTGGGGAADSAAWRTVFESWPCLPIGRQSDGTRLRPTIGAGGRIVALSDREVLLTLGAFKGETRTDPPLEYWDPANAYGKTWRVDVEGGSPVLFTVGHRNPQGLVRTSDGALWLTEHGARGGDELNLLVEGRNYGFPLVSYGTAYEQMTWPSDPAPGRHEGYERPRFAWVPSIAPSQLVEITGAAFPAWRGDLVIGSLGAESLFRLRLDGDRVAYVETIRIGHRIRDLIEVHDGSLVAKTDDDRLVYVLRPGN